LPWLHHPLAYEPLPNRFVVVIIAERVLPEKFFAAYVCYVYGGGETTAKTTAINT
jgi:hypothetical protein